MKSLPLEVARAYLRARSSRLISSVSMLSIAGIGLGVAALVVAMGLLSGYRGEIRENLIGANAEVVLFPLSTAAEADPESAVRRVARLSRVRATSPVIYQSGLASSAATPDGTDVVLKGIDPAGERRVSKIDAFLPGVESLLTRESAGSRPGVAIGVELARLLDVKEGDTILLSVPDNTRGASGLVPRSMPVRVARVFRTNFYESDSELVFLDREVLRRLARMEGMANVIEIKLDTIRNTASAARDIAEAAGKEFSVTDWRSLNSGLFSALAIQQTTLFFVIGLIVAVSTFNIVATLVMTVQEKKRDIGVLTALGAEPKFFPRVFLSLGALLGGAGVVAGAAFGALVCWIMTTFRLLRFPPGVAEIYFVSYIPFRVRPLDVAAIVGFSAVVILLASWISSRRAGRIDIAEALRYE
ncbi:MAG TPA: ABC transporter permease [Thermoanaerobaculia bacterium]|nr:ABC transporter permease [Thermoanaerobaculia bacterium]